MKHEKIQKIFTVVLVMGLLLNAAMVALAFLCYRYQYPALYLKRGVFQVYLLVFPFVPVILAFAGRMVIKKHKVFPRLIAVLMIPAVLLGAVTTLGFLLIPPISSSTNNPVSYMQFDGSVEEFKNVTKSLCPEEIPEGVTVRFQYDDSLKRVGYRTYISKNY